MRIDESIVEMPCQRASIVQSSLETSMRNAKIASAVFADLVSSTKTRLATAGAGV